MANTDTFPKFISNAPFGADQFGSKSQEKIAKSIADHIRNNSTEFKLIGLDGEWGGGKSNVIRIVEKELDGQYHTFIYDAWSHQEDLQRRSFLEELTDDLAKNEVVNREKWNNELNKLLARKKETINKTIPKLSYGIIASLVLALLIPITSAVAGVVENKAWKIILAGLPLILGILAWAVLVLYHFKKTKKWKYLKPENLFYLYKEKDLETQVFETISEKEPSVRDFRNWMERLSADLAQNNLIIVFDNMDRLPAEKVQTFWASIHTFFSEKQYSNIWVIVPFDRKHIQQAFGEGVDNYEKANHFINKTFSVVYSVAPVVLTDWKLFFDTKYKEAFWNTEQSEHKIVRNIFDLHTDVITPRKIIAFINDLVSLKMIWKKEIELRYMSVFILNKTILLKHPLTQLLNKSYLQKSGSIFTNDDQVMDKASALIYNVPLDKASQVAIYRQVELAIRSADYKQLITLSDHPDFFLIFEQIPTEDIEVAASTSSLKVLEDHLQDKKDEETFRMIWNKIIARQATLRIDVLEWTSIFEALLLRSTLVQQKMLVAYFSNQFTNVGNFEGDKYYKVMEQFGKFLHDNNIDIDYTTMVPQREVMPEDMIKYLKLAGDHYKKYNFKYSARSIEDFFLGKIPNGLMDGWVLQFLKEDNFDRLQQAIEKSIRENNITVSNVAEVFDTYKAISKQKPLKEKINDATINNLLPSVETNLPAHYELVTMRMARTKDYPTYGGISQSITNSTDKELIREVAKRIHYYNDFGTMLIDLTQWNQPLLRNVLAEIAINGSMEQRSLHIENILPQFIRITEVLTIDRQILLEAINPWTPHLADKLKISTLQSLIPDPSFYEIAISVRNDLANKVLETAVAFVNNTTESEWQDAFANETTYLFRVLISLLKGNLISTLPSAIINQYKPVLKLIAEGKRSIISSNNWNELYDKADHVHLVATIKDIRDDFLNHRNITPEQFISFERPLRELGDLQERSGDVVRKILKSVISNDGALNVILPNADFYVSLISKAEEESLDVIKLIRDKIASDPNNSKLSTLARAIDQQLAHAVKVISAKYFSPEVSDKKHTVDVTTKIVELVQGQKVLHFKITNELFNNDPHPGIRKKFEVHYQYMNSKHNKTCNENEWMGLP